MRSSVFLFGSIMAALSLTAGAAGAGEQEYPVSFVERPLTLPRFTLAPELEIDINRLPGAAVTTGATGNIPVVAGMQIGAAFGITKDLEVGAIVLPIQFNGGGGYGGLFVGDETVGEPQAYATFRFLHLDMLDVGARVRIYGIPPHGGLPGGAILEPSIPLLLHIGKLARLDAELGVPITIVSSTAPTAPGSNENGVHAGLDLPIRLAFDIIEPLHVGVSTGVHVDDFSEGSQTAIPLGVFAGYAIGEKRPLIDIDPFFSFYEFITPGGGPVGDKANPGLFVVGVNAKGYLYF